MSRVTPERQVAFAVLRSTFESDEHTEAAFREEAAGRELTGRTRAQAQRLTFGAVQRRGTTDWVIGSFTKQKGRRPDPPVAAALRLGIFELLFSDGTPDHAAVDQAVSLVREAGAGHAAGFANAVLRRTLRERDSILERLADDSSPEKAAVAHSFPDWLARLWWEELGRDRAVALMAAANRPAEKAVRVNTARITPEEAIERFSGPDLELTRAERPWPLAPPELLIARGSLAAIEEAADDGLVVAQSRGSAAVVEVLDPLEGEGHRVPEGQARVGEHLVDRVTLSEHEHPDLATGAGREGDGATHHLVGLAGVDAEPEHHVDGLVEGGGGDCGN